MSIQLSAIGRYATGVFDEGAAEINTYDPATQRLFVVNSNSVTVDILDLSDPTNPTPVGRIDATQFGAGANSVAVKNGILAVAIEADPATDPGKVVFFDTNGTPLGEVPAGSLPDMVTFTPDGSKVLVANEGEPDADAGIDPNGSVSIIDLSGGVGAATVRTAEFVGLNGTEDALRAQGVRIFPGRAAAADFEPEYIAVAPNGLTAFVTLQENNAVAAIDINSATVAAVQPLGLKDWSGAGGTVAELDASDEDGTFNLANWPVVGMYMPDAIAAFEANGQVFYATANEGDARDEDARVADLTLDPAAFPNAATLQEDANLGRLEVSTVDGDPDGDGDYDRLFAYGARSFSIFDANGNLVFDSGDQLERFSAELYPNHYNADGDSNEPDARSDAKGPEPEGIVTGIVGDRTYAFVGLERIGGIAVYDVTDPAAAAFVQYINPRDFSTTEEEIEAGLAGDIGPEGLTFIAASDSPTAQPLLVVSNEVSGSTTVFAIGPAPVNTATTEGDDVLVIGAGNQAVAGLGGNDVLYANQGNDLLAGDEGDDILFGGKGNDNLNGGPGNDTLYGDFQGDVLAGGPGSDTFALGSDTGFDVIADFETGVDRIGLLGGLTSADVSVATTPDGAVIFQGIRPIALAQGTPALDPATFVSL